MDTKEQLQIYEQLRGESLEAAKELAALREIVGALEPLAPDERARVLLWFALRFAPDAFSQRAYAELVLRAQATI